MVHLLSGPLALQAARMNPRSGAASIRTCRSASTGARHQLLTPLSDRPVELLLARRTRRPHVARRLSCRVLEAFGGAANGARLPSSSVFGDELVEVSACALARAGRW